MTKRKSTSGNPGKPEENSIRLAILRIAYTNFLSENAYNVWQSFFEQKMTQERMKTNFPETFLFCFITPTPRHITLHMLMNVLKFECMSVSIEKVNHHCLAWVSFLRPGLKDNVRTIKERLLRNLTFFFLNPHELSLSSKE